MTLTRDITPAWRRFEKQLAQGRSARDLGFHAKDGDVSRYLARFRIAGSYRSALFDDVSKPTADAYSALIGLLLAWSAFEQLARICGFIRGNNLDYAKIDGLFAEYSASLVNDDWAAVRPAYAFLATFTTAAALSSALQGASGGAPLRPRQLIVALRNAFAHGQLTAHFGGAAPRAVAKACRSLSAHLLTVQASHFASVVLERTV
jgi:hypothetical protein